MFIKIIIHLLYILRDFQGFFIALRKGDILPLYLYIKIGHIYPRCTYSTNRTLCPNMIILLLIGYSYWTT